MLVGYAATSFSMTNSIYKEVGRADIEAFIINLAGEKQVSASPQSQLPPAEAGGN